MLLSPPFSTSPLCFIQSRKGMQTPHRLNCSYLKGIGTVRSKKFFSSTIDFAPDFAAVKKKPAQ